MDARLSACLVLVLAALALRGELEAAAVPHGGTYGPGPAGSLPPLCSIHSHPSPGPGGPGGLVGTVIAPKTRSWRESWDSEKSRYLVMTNEQRLARGLRRPTKLQISNDLVPALFSTLESTERQELQAQLLIALARVGRDPAGRALPALLRAQLSSPSDYVQKHAVRACAMLDGEYTPGPLTTAVDPAGRRELAAAIASNADPAERARCALALGRLLRENGERLEPSELAALKALLAVHAQQANGAAAIALGLAGATEARAELRSRFEEHWGRDPICGSLAVALALLHDEDAKPSIEALIDSPTREPGRMLDAADALRILGDARSALVMTRRLGEDDVFSLELYHALADSIAAIGDSSSVAPLVRLLQDTEQHSCARGAAARALAGMAKRR